MCSFDKGPEKKRKEKERRVIQLSEKSDWKERLNLFFRYNFFFSFLFFFNFLFVLGGGGIQCPFLNVRNLEPSGLIF